MWYDVKLYNLFFSDYDFLSHTLRFVFAPRTLLSFHWAHNINDIRQKFNLDKKLWLKIFSAIVSNAFFAAHALRVKRQESTTARNDAESFEKELCKDKDAGEWFRLVAGDGDACRDVIQCTSSVC